MKQSGEPSVEEILESIKKVIARDNRAGGSDGILPQSAPANGALIMQAADFADEEEGEILDLADAGEIEPSPLIADAAVTSMRESLAALASLSGPGASPQIVRSGETSLEGLARELLRPMLAEWLDKNLPAMVERLVAAEIARIVGKRG